MDVRLRPALLFPTTVAAGLLAFALEPSAAEACGGFFCSSSPVDQSGEGIIYAKEPDGTLVMSVRVEYEGDDDAFAWILPVPTAPELSVGTEAAFLALQMASEPVFVIDEQRTTGTCRDTPECFDEVTGDSCDWGDDDVLESADGPPSRGGFADMGAAAPSDPDRNPVTVYSRGPVGPFETVVLGAASAADVLDWLRTNGYDLPAESEEPLQAYADAGHVFVALKLATDSSSRFIQPITMRMGTDEVGCLPLRLTRIAAVPDMPITTYFLGDARVIPTNYSQVRVDVEELPELWTGERRWSGAVGAIVDTVGGQGFVTEYAGDAPPIDIELPSVADLATESDPSRFLQELQGRGFAASSSLLAALEAYMAPPEDQDSQSYYNCLSRGGVGECGRPSLYDPAGLADHLETSEVEPRRAMQALVARHRYLTRMSTAMDPEEMTVDPLFEVDDAMPAVSNVHLASRVARCSSDYYEGQTPVDLLIGETTHRIEDGQRADEFDWCAQRWGTRCVTYDELPPAARRRDGGLCHVGAAGASGGGAAGLGLVAIAFALVFRRRR